MTKCAYCGRQAYIAHLCPYCRKYYCLEHRDTKAHDCPSQKKPEPQPIRAVTKAIEPKTRREKKELLTIRFTFLEDKKRSSQKETVEQTKAREPHPVFRENQEAALFAVKDVPREDPSKSPYAETVKSPPITKETARAIAFPTFFDGVSKKIFAFSFILVVVEEIMRLVSYVQNPPFLAYLEGNLFVRLLNDSMAPHVASLIVYVLMCSILFLTARLASLNKNSVDPGFSVIKRAIPLVVYVTVSLLYIVWIVNWFFILF